MMPKTTELNPLCMNNLNSFGNTRRNRPVNSGVLESLLLYNAIVRKGPTQFFWSSSIEMGPSLSAKQIWLISHWLYWVMRPCACATFCFFFDKLPLPLRTESSGFFHLIFFPYLTEKGIDRAACWAPGVQTRSNQHTDIKDLHDLFAQRWQFSREMLFVKFCQS